MRSKRDQSEDSQGLLHMASFGGKPADDKKPPIGARKVVDSREGNRAKKQEQPYFDNLPQMLKEVDSPD